MSQESLIRFLKNRWEIEQKQYEVYGHRPIGLEKDVYNKFIRKTLKKLFSIPIASGVKRSIIEDHLKEKGLPKEILWMFASPDHCSFCFFPFKSNPPLIRACLCQ